METNITRTLLKSFAVSSLMLFGFSVHAETATLMIEIPAFKGVPPVQCGKYFTGVCTIIVPITHSNSLRITNTSSFTANNVALQDLSVFAGELTQDASACHPLLGHHTCDIVLTTTANAPRMPHDAVVKGSNTNSVVVTVQEGFP